MKRAPVAPEKLSTSPWSSRAGKASTVTCAGWPTRIAPSCVSLKLAVTQTPRRDELHDGLAGAPTDLPDGDGLLRDDAVLRRDDLGVRELERGEIARGLRRLDLGVGRARLASACCLITSTSLDCRSLADASATRLFACEALAAMLARRERATPRLASESDSAVSA